MAELAAAYNLLPFEVALLAPTRTLCEKIMSLVRFSYTDKPLVDLRNKIRHVYDLYQLLQQADLSTFFDSDSFDSMLYKVGRDDEVSFRNNKDWLYHHPAQALLFADLDRVWPELRSTYYGSFRNLVFGELPADEDVFQTLKRIQERLKLVVWDIGHDL